MTERVQRGRWRASALAIVTLAAAAAAALGASLLAPAPKPAARHPAPSGELRTPAAAESSAASVAAAQEARGRAVSALLARRAAALRAHDVAAYLATDDPADPALRSRDAAVVRDAVGVPFAEFSYTFDPKTELTPQPPSLARYGAPVYAPAVVYEHYALSGFDPTSTEEAQYDTFVRRAGRWYFASGSDFAAEGDVSTPDLWDFGPVVVTRRSDVLALGHPQVAALTAQVAAEAARDIPRVDAVWGTDWARHAVVLVPATQAELGRLLAAGPGLSQIAAVATAELPQGQARSAVGNRILVNPATFAGLPGIGRQVVITHELTHVAARADTGPDLPEWLIEGFADYVGYLDTDLPPPVVAGELAAQVRAGHLPAALPPNAAFLDTSHQLAQAYEEGWLACRLIAARYGQPALVSLYRQVGTAPVAAGQAGALDSAFRARLHTSVAAFTAAWRAYLRTELG